MFTIMLCTDLYSISSWQFILWPLTSMYIGVIGVNMQYHYLQSFHITIGAVQSSLAQGTAHWASFQNITVVRHSLAPLIDSWSTIIFSMQITISVALPARAIRDSSHLIPIALIAVVFYYVANAYLVSCFFFKITYFFWLGHKDIYDLLKYKLASLSLIGESLLYPKTVLMPQLNYVYLCITS